MEEKKVTLRLVGRGKRENLRFYYTVRYKDEEYDVPVFPFQMKREPPTELHCIVKDDGVSMPKITQDYSYVIAELYKVGEIYSFRVKDLRNNYYNVIDTHGFLFRLTEFGEKELIEGQSIRACVTSIDRIRVCLRLVDSRQALVSKFLSCQQLAEKADIDGEKLMNILDNHHQFSNARSLYKAEDGVWLLEAVSNFDDVLTAGGDDTVAGKDTAMMAQKLCMLILEESDILKRMDSGDRDEWIERLTKAAQNFEDYISACRITAEGKGKSYILEQLQKLKDSEYLYQPERKFRILMNILNLDEMLIPDIMDRLFDIILEGDKQHWKAEPFRTAFVNLLDLFITEYRDRVAHAAGSPLIHKMIKAIAIQLLLSNENDNIDRRLNRSTYYRLLTYSKWRIDMDGILDDAFNSLFTKFSEDFEYSWDDIKVLDTLCFRAAYKPKTHKEKSFQTQIYPGKDVELVADAQGVTIRPVTGAPQSINVQALLAWHNLDIKAYAPVKCKLKDNGKLSNVKKFWAETEEKIFDTSLKIVNRASMSPQEGDTVLIKVTGIDEASKDLYCEIVSDGYEGNGWLQAKNVIEYMDSKHDNKHYFFDSKGAPYILEATIVGDADEEGEFEFSMRKQVLDYLMGLHNCNDEVDCTIMTTCIDVNEGPCYVGIMSDGSSCLIPNEDLSLQRGDGVRARVASTKSNGQYVCTFEDMLPDFKTSVPQACTNLIAALNIPSDDDVIEEPTAIEKMETEVVREIIGILDRESALAEDRCRSYSFLCIVGILSKMIEDEKATDYYEKRKTLIVAFDEYEKNGNVNEKKLEQLKDNIGQELLEKDYLVNDYMTKFQILDILKHKNNMDALFSIRESTSNPSIRNAADLSIALLLTDKFDIPNIQRPMLDKINQEIGVEVKLSSDNKYGIETSTKEFKSSVVYPAGYHMQPSKDMQGAVIMQTICGFLNSDNGGTLYLGIDKYGFPCGVHNDMKYLGKDEDGYGRYIHGLIYSELGVAANQCCNDCNWIEDDGYKIYVMNIRPCSELVSYKGQYWIRQDTEKRPLHEDKIEGYRKMHDEAYKRYLAAGNAEVATGVDDAASQPVAEETKETKSNSDKIHTSSWRNNDNYDNDMGTLMYLHLRPDWKYVVIDQRRSYKNDELCLSITNEEGNGFLVVAYESGRMLTVDINGLSQKTWGKENARCKTEVPKYVCPAKEGDGVLTVWENTIGDICARVDEYESLAAKHCDGNLTDNGAPLVESKYKRFVACEVVPQQYLAKFQKFRGQKGGLGQKLRTEDVQLINNLLKMKLD